MARDYVPLIQKGGECDGQYRPAVFENGKFLYVAFLAVHQLWYPLDECKIICTALQIAYDSGVEDATRAAIDKLVVPE